MVGAIAGHEALLEHCRGPVWPQTIDSDQQRSGSGTSSAVAGGCNIIKQAGGL